MTVFTDKVDVDGKISLYEYGIIRDPKTNKTVMCINTGDYLWGGQKPEVKILNISQDDVLEQLYEMEEGFFSYIGQNRDDVIQDTFRYDDNLSYLIMTMNVYNGCFYWN